MKEFSIHEQMLADRHDKEIFEQAKSYALAYLDEISERTVYPTESALQGLSNFDESLPELPHRAADILGQLHRQGSPATVAQAGGRYFGFVNGNAIPIALAARWLADAWDQNAAFHVMSPVAAKLEQICQQWLVQLFGLPEGTVAGLVGGTTMATFCGLAAARQKILQQMGWDLQAKGLFGAPRFRVVLSEQAHGSVFKALALLGIGRDMLEMTPADAQGRIDTTQLPALDDQTLLILQAGNVNTGAFDEFEQICGRANEAGAWVHIDGAFGLWAAASRNTGHLTRGIELADSWSVDGHKTLNTPYDCGIILCRHQEMLAAAMQATGSYLHYSDQRDGLRYVPDMSRRARSIELWATLKFLGRSGIEELVDGLCARAKQFGRELRGHGFRILNEVVFNQVLIACDTEEQTLSTLAWIQHSGVLWCGSTMWQGKPAIRISVCSWSTTADDVALCAKMFARAKQETSAPGE